MQSNTTSLLLVGILLAVVTLRSITAKAASPQSSLSQNETKLPKAKQEKFHANFNFIHTEKSVQTTESKEASFQTLESTLAYTLSSQLAATSGLEYSQNSKDSEDPRSGLSDLFVGGQLLLGESKSHRSQLAGNIILPTSKVSKDYDNLKFAVSSKYSFSWLSLGNSPVAASIGASAKKYFTEYDTQKNGEPVKAWQHSEIGNLVFRKGKFSISASLENSHHYNSLNRRSDFFAHSQELSIQLSSQFELALGHSNTGNWLKEDGSSSNFSSFSQNDSYFYARAGIQL